MPLMKKILRNLRRILFEDDFDIVELFASVNSVGWGLWFISHPDLFDSGATVYRVISQFGNEFAWGTAFLSVGVLRFVGVALDRYRIRKFAAMAGVVLWSFICASFYQQNSDAVVVLVTAQNAILSAWEYLRHSRRARIRKEVREEIHSDRRHV